MIIDIHPHVIAEDTRRYPLAPLGGHRSDWSRDRPVSFEKMITAMDEAGIQKSALVQASTCYGHDNSYVADAIAAHPDRFTGVFSVDVLAADAVDKIQYWVSKGFSGLRLFTTGSTMRNQADWLDDARSFPAWECVGELGIPVCVQMTAEAIPQLTNMIERFPHVKIILDHLARPVLEDGPPYTRAANLFGLAKYKNVYLKMTPRTVADCQRGAATPESFFARLVAEFGASRIAWGSNYPASQGTLAELLAVSQKCVESLSAADRDDIFGKTAQHLYPVLANGGVEIAEKKNSPPVILQTLLANYPHTSALKKGEVHSPIVTFDFADVKGAHTAFDSLVREQKYDIGQLAMVTYLQAKVYGKPYVLLPAVVVARGQHHMIVYNSERGHLTPADLPGRRVGVRAYSQTTGAWVRGILEEDYGVDFRRVQWITFEDPHLAEYREPEWVERAPTGKKLHQMLLDGEIDAAILGAELPDDARLKTLIPDADAAARKWADSHGGVPINHMVVVKESIVRSRPDVVKEVYRLLEESKDAAPGGPNSKAIRFGVEANRQSLEVIIEYAFRQKLIPRRFEVDELFDESTRYLK